jgi:hypothetical protein
LDARANGTFARWQLWLVLAIPILPLAGFTIHYGLALAKRRPPSHHAETNHFARPLQQR